MSLGDGLNTQNLRCDVVIVHAEALGRRDTHGVDLYDCAVTVVPPEGAPWEYESGVPVPDAGLPLLYPGSRMPAHLDGGAVIIDWDIALSGRGS